MNNNQSENELILQFLSEKKGINPKNAAKYLQGLDKQKQQDLAREYQQWKESKKKEQTKRIAHGAKLQYVKSLKHICPEGEELVYYKKGGSVTCGCMKKKKEQGGEIIKDEPGGIVDKFKKKGESVARKITDTIAIITGTKSGVDEAKKIKEKEQSSNVVGDGTTKSHRFDVKPKKFKNDYSSKRVKDSEKDYLEGKGDHLYKNGSKLKSAGCGRAVKKFKAKCGSKLKKHQQGGSLNGIPFMQEGTSKGGIKSDNTKVARIPNNGEGVYERTSEGIGDFLPLVGTMRAAQRIDRGEPNASYGDLAANAAMDALGFGMVGPVIKASAKASKLAKLLKSRGFNKITEQGIYRSQPNTYMKIAPKTIKHQYYNETKLMPYFKQVPTVDVSNIALQPLVQTLRVPATASFK